MSGGAEMIAGAVVQHVAGMLGEVAWERVELLWSFKDDVDEMKDNLLTLQGVLGDAENRSRGKEAAPERRWLKKLKSVAYNMEDALQELEANAMIWKNSPCTHATPYRVEGTLDRSLPDTVREVQGEDQHKIAHIPEVKFE